MREEEAASASPRPTPPVPPRAPGLLHAAVLRVSGNVAAAAATLGASVLLARGLGPVDRGVLAAVAAPVLLAATLVQTSAGNVLSAQVASRRRSVAESASPALAVMVVLSLLLCAVLLALSGVLLEDPDHQVYLRVLLVALVLQSFSATVRGVRMGQHRHRALSSEVVLTALVRVALLLVLALADQLTVATAVAVVALTYLTPALFLSPRMPLRTRGFWRHTRYFGKGVLRSLPGTAATQLNARIDQPVLAAFAANRQLGLYVVAVALAETPRIALNALRQVFLTDAAQRIDHERVALLARLVFLALLPAVGLGVWLADEVVLLLYGEAYRPAATAVVILLIGTLVAAPGSFLTTSIFAAGHQGRAGAPALAGLCVTVPALVLLVPPYGAVGAAVASTLSYATTSATGLVLFCRYSGMSARAVVTPRRQDAAALRQALARVRPGAR